MARTKQDARKIVSKNIPQKKGDVQITERLTELENQVRDILKEIEEIKKTIKHQPTGDDTKHESTIEEPKTVVKETKSKKNKESKADNLTKDAVKAMIKKDLMAALDKRSIPYKKADKVDVLKTLLYDYINNNLQSEDKSSSEKKINVSEVNNSDKKIISITSDDLKKGYSVDENGFVYTLDAKSVVVAKLKNDDMQLLTKTDINKLKKLEIPYNKIESIEQVKKLLKPKKLKKTVELKKDTESKDKSKKSKNKHDKSHTEDVQKSESATHEITGSEVGPAREIKDTGSEVGDGYVNKSYADENAEGSEFIHEDTISKSFDTVDLEEISQEDFRKIEMALMTKKIKKDDPIDEIADLLNIPQSTVGNILINYKQLEEKWPSKKVEDSSAEDVSTTVTKPLKNNRKLIKPRAGAK